VLVSGIAYEIDLDESWTVRQASTAREEKHHHHTITPSHHHTITPSPLHPFTPSPNLRREPGSRHPSSHEREAAAPKPEPPPFSA
jgi:hypothetical protein